MELLSMFSPRFSFQFWEMWRDIFVTLLSFILRLHYVILIFRIPPLSCLHSEKDSCSDGLVQSPPLVCYVVEIEHNRGGDRTYDN